MTKEFKINVICSWDAEAKVWTATSEDLPGLVSESASIPDLIQRVMDVAPELIESNLLEKGAGGDFLVNVLPVYQQTIHIASH